MLDTYFRMNHFAVNNMQLARELGMVVVGYGNRHFLFDDKGLDKEYESNGRIRRVYRKPFSDEIILEEFQPGTIQARRAYLKLNRDSNQWYVDFEVSVPHWQSGEIIAPVVCYMPGGKGFVSEFIRINTFDSGWYVEATGRLTAQEYMTGLLQSAVEESKLSDLEERLDELKKASEQPISNIDDIEQADVLNSKLTIFLGNLGLPGKLIYRL